MRKQLVRTVQEFLDDDRLVLLLGDIGVFGFRDAFKKHPDRVYNIGILEQSTVSLASGMSMNGLIPVIHTIAPFLVERCLEQLKVDFGYQKLGGNFVSVGSSYDYAALGCTHHCPGDVSQLLTIPNMEVILPGSSEEFHQLFSQAYDNANPTYFRLSEYENKNSYQVKLGKANVVKKGSSATVICVGNSLQNTLEATSEMDITILYYTSVNPFDSETLLNNFNENLIVIEPYYEGAINYKISKALQGRKYRLTNVGVPHEFLTNYGTKAEHDKKIGLDPQGIRNKIVSCIS